MATINFPSQTNQQLFLDEVLQQWPHLEDAIREDGDSLKMKSEIVWDDPGISEIALGYGAIIEDYR